MDFFPTVITVDINFHTIALNFHHYPCDFSSTQCFAKKKLHWILIALVGKLVLESSYEGYNLKKWSQIWSQKCNFDAKPTWGHSIAIRQTIKHCCCQHLHCGWKVFLSCLCAKISKVKISLFEFVRGKFFTWQNCNQFATTSLDGTDCF